MRKLSVVASMAISLCVSAQASCDDLYISEYIEGSSYNKAIELYNPQDTKLDLSFYTLELYSNGKSAANASLTLSGELDAKGVYVLANSRADSAILDKANLQNNSVINFNGDDALVLKKDGVIIDTFGQVGVDPGSSWSANGISTKDMTLLRKTDSSCEVQAFFDPSLQWDGLSKDSFANLGLYEAIVTPEPKMEFAYIHDIQGEGDTSELTGASRAIEGIIIGAYLKNGLNGFFIQEEEEDMDDNENTSEGLFVYCPNCTQEISLGQKVYVEGVVSEYNNMTQLTASLLEVRAENLELPSLSEIALPITNLSDYESKEAMLVNITASSSLYVNDNYNLARYGSFSLGSERAYQFTQEHEANPQGYKKHQEDFIRKNIIIDDGNSIQNPEHIPFPQGGLSAQNTLRAGYSVENFIGVLDERYGSYRVQKNALSNLDFNVSSNERMALQTESPSKSKFVSKLLQKYKKTTQIRIASYNVLNYFNTFDGCTYGLEGGSAGCRGADNEEEFQRQRTKIIEALKKIDADVYGLMEIENDGYDASSALADLVNGLNESLGKDVYAYLNVDEMAGEVDALGSDAIKVAMIYNKKRVRAVGKTHVLKLDEADKNRPSLIQVFKKKYGSRKFLVSVNHFKSKGSSCKNLVYDEVADINLEDGQGNCNLTRTYAAKKLTSYIDTQRDLRNIKKSLLLGDFNAYAKEDPILTMQANGYDNLLANEKGLKAYSYIFKGQLGTLDYALGSAKLAKKVKNIQVWNVNADEPRALDYNLEYKSNEQKDSFYEPDVYRASDHDPIIVDIRL